eukprot:3246623-Ditylum_brightwellii.AAC.1
MPASLPNITTGFMRQLLPNPNTPKDAGPNSAPAIRAQSYKPPSGGETYEDNKVYYVCRVATYMYLKNLQDEQGKP